jgi:hypothetical protein
LFPTLNRPDFEAVDTNLRAHAPTTQFKTTSPKAHKHKPGLSRDPAAERRSLGRSWATRDYSKKRQSGQTLAPAAAACDGVDVAAEVVDNRVPPIDKEAWIGSSRRRFPQ